MRRHVAEIYNRSPPFARDIALRTTPSSTASWVPERRWAGLFRLVWTGSGECGAGPDGRLIETFSRNLCSASLSIWAGALPPPLLCGTNPSDSAGRRQCVPQGRGMQVSAGHSPNDLWGHLPLFRHSAIFSAWATRIDLTLRQQISLLVVMMLTSKGCADVGAVCARPHAFRSHCL